jgi:Zinc carboxypeptidase
MNVQQNTSKFKLMPTISQDRFWRKTRSPNAGSSCVGTDPNRNFDWNWGGEENKPIIWAQKLKQKLNQGVEFPANANRLILDLDHFLKSSAKTTPTSSPTTQPSIRSFLFTVTAR